MFVGDELRGNSNVFRTMVGDETPKNNNLRKKLVLHNFNDLWLSVLNYLSAPKTEIQNFNLQSLFLKRIQDQK